MLDLKPYLDAVNSANDDVVRIAHEIDQLFTEGSDESKQQAVGMRSALEEAQTKQANAIAMYESMQKANRPNDIARNFVPVSQTDPAQAEGEQQPNLIKRSDYDAMSLVDRAKFVRAGGQIED